MLITHIAYYNCLKTEHYDYIKDATLSIVQNSNEGIGEDPVKFMSLEDGAYTSFGEGFLTQDKILKLFDASLIKKPIYNTLGCPGVYTQEAGIINRGSQVETWLDIIPPGGSRLTHRNASGIFLNALSAKQPITSFIYFIKVDEGNDKFYFYENDVKTYVDIKENMLLIFKPHVKHGIETNRTDKPWFYLTGNVRLLNGPMDGSALSLGEGIAAEHMLDVIDIKKDS